MNRTTSDDEPPESPAETGIAPREFAPNSPSPPTPLPQRGEGSIDDPHDPYGALRFRDYRFFLIGNLLSSLGLQMQKVTVGWEIVQRIPDPAQAAMAIAWVGFVQVMPVIALAIPVGHCIDRYNRKAILMLAAVLILLGSLGLAAVAASRADLGLLYSCLLVSGIGRAFQQPSKAAFLPQIVPRAHFSNAVTWNTGGFHLASIVGPLFAGGLLWLFRSPALVYTIDAAAVLVLVLLLVPIVGRPFVPAIEATSLRSLAAGISFVWRTKLILGAISLDMFAVLLGGATALLPLYAERILHVGPVGLGMMSAAPAVGALLMAFVLAHRPPLSRAGPAMLLAVAGFGLATIVFGFSRSYSLSLAMLFLTGALDNISVVVRHTLVQVLTPDSMRGRVAAVNSMFIGASNELGGFESGLVAALFSPTISVVSGGIGTLVVVGLVSLLWPQVRAYGRLGSGPGKDWQT